MRNNSVLVYRIEGEDGIGPYNSENRMVSDDRLYDHARGNCRPNAHNDFYKAPNGSWFESIEFYKDMESYSDLLFGFKSISKLKRWFNGRCYKDLVEDGFYITVYEVHKDKVKEGHSKKQIVFDRSSARLVSRNLLA